ncbi:hypothetical protein EWM64_g9922, partial [Hericium alpestre]
MSFSFQWPRFSDQFHADAIDLLTSALNKGSKPPVIADKIEVVELEMGTQPPELEIRDIGDLTMDQFRGIFRLTYAGDAHLVLRTKVQANPLNHKQHEIDLMSGSRGMLAAKQPLVVPMLLRLSHFRLNAYVVLVVSRQKGITLVFKTDPLQNVDINSTFDSIAVIQKFIQREIEGQLRQMFREDLPGIIHRLSQQWVKAKVEAPYLTKQPPPPSVTPSASQRTTMSAPATYTLRPPPLGLHSPLFTPGLGPPLVPYRTRTVSVASSSSQRQAQLPQTPAPEPPDTAFPDLENFDPTYGLRPEGLPAKSVFGNFGRVFGSTASRGLADLAEEEEGEEMEEGGSYDVIEWEDTVYDVASSVAPTEDEILERMSVTEYETIPAVGGGVVTRPRVIHSQSQVQPPAGITRPPSSFSQASTARLNTSTMDTSYFPPSTPLTAGPQPRRAHSLYDPYFALPSSASAAGFLPNGPSQAHQGTPRTRTRSTPPTPPLYHSPYQRPTSPSHASRSSDRTHSIPTPPSSDHPAPPYPIPTKRRPSLSLSTAPPQSPPLLPTTAFSLSSSPPADPAQIVLQPTLNNTVSHLNMLSHSNHTLSPYTRALEHFTVRTACRTHVPTP